MTLGGAIIESDTDLVRELRARLNATERDRDELRAALAGEAEQLERDDAEAEARSSRHWFALWREGNRKRARLAVQQETDLMRVAQALDLDNRATVDQIVERALQLRGVVR